MLSIIVPVLNEAESLETLYREIGDATRGPDQAVEILFVDDGSSDASWNVIQSLADRDDSVSGIRFRRNFGKAAALTAGMRAARGDLLLMIDAPARRPGRNSADAVQAGRRVRRRQRLEGAAARSLAQGLSKSGF